MAVDHIAIIAAVLVSSTDQLLQSQIHSCVSSAPCNIGPRNIIIGRGHVSEITKTTDIPLTNEYCAGIPLSLGPKNPRLSTSGYDSSKLHIGSTAPLHERLADFAPNGAIL